MDSIVCTELGFKNFTVYRKDRPPESGHEVGGGVLIAIHKSFYSCLCNSIDIGDIVFDQLFVSVNVGNSNIIIGSVYIPPYAELDCYLDHLAAVDAVYEMYPDHEKLFIGDYNIPHVSWSNNFNCESSFNFKLSEKILEYKDKLDALNILCNRLSYYNLRQCNYFPNINNNTLDLCFSSSYTNVNLSIDSLLRIDIAHPPIDIDFSLNTNISHNVTNYHFDYSVLNFKCANYELINQDLFNISWSRELENLDIDAATSKFYNIVFSVINNHTPIKKVKYSPFPIWYSRELKNLICKKKAHKNFKIFRKRSLFI